jgi:hypothetical protein
VGAQLVRLDTRAQAWVDRHQTWRFVVTTIVVETIFFSAVSVTIGGLRAWWFGPLVGFANLPVFVIFMPDLGDSWLVRLDDRILGRPPRQR